MGISLFLLINVYFSLLLKVIHGCFWPENIMASPFNQENLDVMKVGSGFLQMGIDLVFVQIRWGP